MDISFLPEKIALPLLEKHKSGITVWEIRIRENAPILLRTTVKDEYLINPEQQTEIRAEQKDIMDILLAVSGQALYRISESMCGGVVFTNSGVRIGLCGCGVFSQGKIRSLTNVTSLCIRFPYVKTGNAQLILPYLQNGVEQKIDSTLIISPPAGGKTTLLRDFAITFAQKTHNVVVVDERLEIACLDGVPWDVIREIPKDQAALMALRSLNPDYIICDEIVSLEEMGALKRAKSGGVSVFATMHADCLKHALSSFSGLTTVFERFVILQAKDNRMYTVTDKLGNCLAEGEL